MTLTETKIKTISLNEVAELADLDINQELYSKTGIFIRRNVFVNEFRKAIKSVDKDIFRLKEVRIFFLKKGDVKYLLNFEEYEIKSSSLVILPPNCVLEIKEVSVDAECEIIAVNEAFFESESMVKIFSPLWMQPFIHRLTGDEMDIVEKYFSLIQTLRENSSVNSSKSSLQYLMISFIMNAKSFAEKEKMEDSYSPYKVSIFHRFVSLVGEHYKQQRTVGFYAERLSLTPHYLSALIKQTSGETVMQWINKMVIFKAKELLKEGNLLVYEIADELNFPNPSFFSRFFKKQTGITPFQYQKQNFRDVLPDVR